MAAPKGTEVLKRIGAWGGASAVGAGLAAGAVGLSAGVAIGAAVVTGLATGFWVLIRAFKR